MDDILARCKKTLEAHYGERFAGLVLYGSMARDEARVDSDIDLLVLLHEPIDYFRELRTLTDLLYPIQLVSDRLISAKPAAVDEYKRGSLRLYRNVAHDGIRV
jgi:predicted nucleotidyltransferase